MSILSPSPRSTEPGWRLARRASLAAALAVALPAAHALEFEYSGFASAIAGRSFGPCTPDNTLGSRFNGSCTRFIADWSHAGVYTPSVSMKPESRLGLQVIARLNDQLSGTTQLVARAANGTQADLEWAYLTYKPSVNWTLQAGRKRLPLFYFSDFQDVGYAYGWLRPPPDVYGWDVVNYNGANASYQTHLSGWSLKADVFGGNEESKDNIYSTIIYSGQPKDVLWKNIRGAALELNRAWFTGRLVVIANEYQQRDRNTDSYDTLNSGRTLGRQRIYGLSANVDADPWLMRSEYSLFDRSDFQYKTRAFMVSVGYRVGKFTPMLTTSAYRETTNFPATYNPLIMRSHALTLRYEVGQSSSLKLQFDRNKDLSQGVPFGGTANAVGLGFDTVF